MVPGKGDYPKMTAFHVGEVLYINLSRRMAYIYIYLGLGHFFE